MVKTLHPRELPSEILLMIFSLVPISDIKNLRLVNHIFHNCASQSLFQTIEITSKKDSWHLWKKITEDTLFSRGISRIIYNARLTLDSAGEDNICGQAQNLRDDLHHTAEQYNAREDLLRAGIARLPMLREVVITDEPPRVPQPSEGYFMYKEQPQDTLHNRELSLFILLHVLQDVQIAPRRFTMSLRNYTLDVAASTHEPEPSSQNTATALALFDAYLQKATVVFKNVRHFSISIRGPNLGAKSQSALSFVQNLNAFMLTAGPRLERLLIEVEGMRLPSGDLETSLFTSSIFKISPNRWKNLRSLTIKGLGIDGFDLVAFLSRQSSLEEVILQNLQLTRSNWAGVIDDLCLILGAQFEGPSKSRRSRSRTKTIAPMERIRLDLVHVYEPYDERLEAPLSVSAVDLVKYFAGREDNPLRTCYENFVVTPLRL
jgi:hypothetical protein